MPLFEAFAPHIKHNPVGFASAKRQNSAVEHQRARASAELAHAHAHMMTDAASSSPDQIKSFHFATRTITVHSVLAPHAVPIEDRHWYKPEGTFETIMDSDGTTTFQSSLQTKIVESPSHTGERARTFEFGDGISITQSPGGDEITFNRAVSPTNECKLSEFYLANGKQVSLFESFENGHIIKRFVMSTNSVEFRIGDWNTWEVLKRFEKGDYVLDRYRAGRRTSRWQYYAISQRGVVTDDYGVRYFKQNKDGTLTFLDPTAVEPARSTSFYAATPTNYAM